MQYEPKINGYEVVGMLFIMGTNSFYCYFFKKTILNHFLNDQNWKFQNKSLKIVDTQTFNYELIKHLAPLCTSRKIAWIMSR